MTYAEPVYMLALAFTPWPLVTCFGFEGLPDTVPRLEPNLYSVLDERGRLVGDATLAPDGEWWIEMTNGVKAGPGYIIV